VFHALALVEVEDRSTKQFLESFFKIAFIDRYFAAEFLDRDRFADMLDQYFSCLHDLFAVGLIGQEFTIDHIDLFLAEHTIETVEQQHLRLRIDINILEAVGICMIKYAFEYHAGFAAQRKDLFTWLKADCRFQKTNARFQKMRLPSY